MTRPGRLRFLDWVTANGGEALERRGRYEWARFRARSVLCIIYMDRNGQISSTAPALAGEVYRLWLDHQGRERMDLEGGQGPDLAPDEKAIARGLFAAGDRAKAGETLDIPHEAAALGIPPARLIRSLRAQGAIPERA